MVIQVVIRLTLYIDQVGGNPIPFNDIKDTLNPFNYRQ